MKLDEFMAAMQAIESDRKLSKEIVIEALEEALSKAYRKHKIGRASCRERV